MGTLRIYNTASIPNLHPNSRPEVRELISLHAVNLSEDCMGLVNIWRERACLIRFGIPPHGLFTWIPPVRDRIIDPRKNPIHFEYSENVKLDPTFVPVLLPVA